MNITVRQSPIHGRGVFAQAKIEEGHWQYLYGYLKRWEPGSPIDHYCFEWDGDHGYMPCPPFCYLNHSDDPNCEIDTYDEENPMLTIVALRDIQPNEELTIDYGYDPSED